MWLTLDQFPFGVVLVSAYEICKTDVWQSHGKCWLANTKDRNPQPRRAKNKEKCHRGKLLIDEIRTGSEFV